MTYNQYNINDSRKTISFCTTCRNRLWQLESTLEANLKIIENNHEIVLVDYGSSDGLGVWIWNNFEDYIKLGKLKFFEVENDVKWSMSKAKNLAHLLAGGEYLFNIDADNFVTSRDLEAIKYSARNRHLSQQNTYTGTDGRIGISHDFYLKLGGYDESLLAIGGGQT